MYAFISLIQASTPLTEAQLGAFAALVHDRMTEQRYPGDAPLTSFKSDVQPAAVFTVPVMAEGRKALEYVNQVCVADIDR